MTCGTTKHGKSAALEEEFVVVLATAWKSCLESLERTACGEGIEKGCEKVKCPGKGEYQQRDRNVPVGWRKVVGVSRASLFRQKPIAGLQAQSIVFWTGDIPQAL